MNGARAEPLRVLIGPTAAGKKEIGLELARRHALGVVAMDSVKVFRGLRIGAASPSGEETEGIEVRLVGVADPARPYSVGDWVRDAKRAVADLERRGFGVLFLGGTPLYLRALLRGLFEGPPRDEGIRRRLEERVRREGGEGLHRALARLDPAAAQRIHPHDTKRLVRALEVIEKTGRPISALWRERTVLPFSRPLLVAGVDWRDEDLEERQRRRAERMFAAGLVEEVRRLEAEGKLRGEARSAIGYREALRVVSGEWSVERAVAETIRATRRLTRKQRKWFRSFPEVRWVRRVPGQNLEEVVLRVAERLDLPPRRDA